jgi:hypothetical protein
VIQLILFLVLGAGFLFSLYTFARRGSPIEGSSESVRKARHALATLQFGLLPPGMVERIFSKQDYEYLAAGGSKQVCALFLEERRTIALGWVSQVRKQILSLRQFHLGSARYYSRLRPPTEARLALEFLTLLCVCRLLQIALSLRGPYAAPGMVGQAAAAASRVCDISEKSMAFLKGKPFETLGDDAVGNLTPL